MKLPQLCFMVILWAGVACGEQIVIVLDQSTLAGQPGQTLSFFGTVENTTAMELFISNVNLTTDPSLIGNVTPFLINAFTFLSPSFSVLPGSASLSFGLFDVEIPLFALPGTYTFGNEFSLVGGPAFGDQDPLASALFTVVVASGAWQ